MKKFATLACLAFAIFGLALAGPVPCEVRGQDPLNPDCACGPDCKCKADALAAKAKVQTAEPPRGHYVTVCDGKSCRQVFVPDPSPQFKAAFGVADDAPTLTFASPPAKFFHFRGSPTYCASDDGACTETRVRFMERGPIRRAISGLGRR